MTLEVEIPLLFFIIMLWAENAWGEKQRIKELAISVLFVINIVQLHNLPACQRPHFPLYKHEAINAYCWRYIWEKQTLIAFHWQITRLWVNLIAYISKMHFILLHPLYIPLICTKVSLVHLTVSVNFPCQHPKWVKHLWMLWLSHINAPCCWVQEFPNQTPYYRESCLQPILPIIARVTLEAQFCVIYIL